MQDIILFLIIIKMAESVTPKKASTFDSFDNDYLKAFPDLETGKFAADHCASTQACSDYQKVIFQTSIESKVILVLFIAKT